jgi:hypothetical protein
MTRETHEQIRQRLIRKYTRIERDLAQLVRDVQYYIGLHRDDPCPILDKIAGDLEEYRVNLAGARRVLAAVKEDRRIEDNDIRMLLNGTKPAEGST